jgi:FKBP-type peptidyl-prolyl cis-trans isomerase FklB
MMRTGRVGWTALAVSACIAVTAAAAPRQDPAPPTPAGADPGSATLAADKDKSSYAVGMNLGGAIRRQSPELDVDLLVRGFRDALAGEKTLLSPVEMRAILTRLQSDMKAKQAALLGEKAAKAKAESEAFLSANKAKQGVTTLESGLQYRILKAGDGRKPTVDDTVVCHYRGTLIDGTEFDSSYKRAQPATLTVRKLVKGWTEALQLMPVGSKWQIFVPASLGYGERGSGKSIGPNAALIFDVELLAIQDASVPAASTGTGGAAAGLLTRASAPVPALAGINVSFKVDPRITKGLYMGDRWVPVPYSQMGETKQVTVEARAEGVDGNGRPVSISPSWTPADPEVATVVPGQGKEVRITALRPGESSLQVSSQGVSRQLALKAAYKGDVLHVEISQQQ